MSKTTLKEKVIEKCRWYFVDEDFEKLYLTQIHKYIIEEVEKNLNDMIGSFKTQWHTKSSEEADKFRIDMMEQYCSDTYRSLFKGFNNDAVVQQNIKNCLVKDERVTKNLFEENRIEDKSLDFYSVFLKKEGWNKWQEQFAPSSFNLIVENNSKDKSITQRVEIRDLPKELTTIPVIDVENCVPRMDLLENLSEQLLGKSRKIILSGISGLGKTFIAKHFIYHYYETFDHIVWLNCGNGIQNSLTQEKGVELLDNLGLIHEYQSFLQGKIKEEELFSLAFSRLKKMEGNNILVLDNIDERIYDFEDTIELSRNWKIIGTSKEIIEGFHHFAVPDFSENAVELFYKFYEIEKDDDNLIRVLSAIEYHTLAIELLANTAQQRGLRIIELVNRFIEKGINVVEKAKVFTKHNKERNLRIENIEQYINVIFDTSSLDETENKILLNLALLQEESLPIRLFEEIILSGNPDKKSEDLLHSSLTNLQNKGWLYKEPEAIRLHKLTQEVIIKRLESQTYLFKDVLSYLTHKVGYKEFDNYAERLPYLSHSEHLIKNLRKEYSEITLLKNNLSKFYFDLGLYHKSFEFFTPLKIEGYNEPMLYLQSLQGFGIRLYGLGKYDDALQYYSKILNYLNGKNGAKNIKEIEDEFLAFCETNIITENYKSDSVVSFPLMAKFKIIAYSHALNDIGLIFRIKGNAVESLKVFHAAILHRQVLLGGIETYCHNNFESPVFTINDLNESKLDYAKTINGMALTLQFNKNYDEAREYFEMSLKIREELFKPDHPKMSAIYNNLSRLFLESGDLENAKKYILLDIKACISLPSNHPEKIQAHTNLLEYYSLLYKNKNPKIMHSISLMEQKILQKIELEFNKLNQRNIQEGKYYTDLLDYYYTIAREYKRFEFHEKASEYFKKDLAIKQRELQEGSIQLAGANLNIADCLFHILQYEETILHTDKAKEIYKKHFPEDNNHIQYCIQLRKKAVRHIYLSGNKDFLKQDIANTLFPIIVLPNNSDFSDETKLKNELMDLLLSEEEHIDDQIFNHLPKDNNSELMFDKLKEYYDALAEIFSNYQLWKKSIIFYLKKLFVQEKLMKNEHTLFIGMTNFNLSLKYYSDTQYELAHQHNSIATKIYSDCLEENNPMFDTSIIKKCLQDTLTNQKNIEAELDRYKKSKI